MAPATIGVLLVNLGSPDAPETAAVRRYLKEFLSDRRVVDAPRLLWWFVLRGIILPFRAPKSAALYRRVWTEDGSPLIVISETQREGVQATLGDDYAVELAMRYGRPGTADALVRLRDRGCERLVLCPMFPQYAEATFGSVEARIDEQLAHLGWRPNLRTVPPYYDDPGYIDALAARVDETLQIAPADHLVMSFHGLPQQQVDRGDPYARQCDATAQALATRLGLPEDGWTRVFQSRFGPQPWLQPYADQLVPTLAPRYKRLAVTCPGFVADCIETIDEIGELLAETFRAAGGEELRLVPCVNDHPRWIEAVAALVRRAAETPA